VSVTVKWPLCLCGEKTRLRSKNKKPLPGEGEAWLLFFAMQRLYLTYGAAGIGVCHFRINSAIGEAPGAGAAFYGLLCCRLETVFLLKPSLRVVFFFILQVI
jgi:hypothetical protein